VTSGIFHPVFNINLLLTILIWSQKQLLDTGFVISKIGIGVGTPIIMPIKTFFN